MNPLTHKWETIYIALGQTEAEIVRGRLTAEDIPSILTFESIGQTFGVTTGLGQVAVKVPSELAEQAREILADEDEPADEGA